MYHAVLEAQRMHELEEYACTTGREDYNHTNLFQQAILCIDFRKRIHTLYDNI
jgi:hypothetical protein